MDLPFLPRDAGKAHMSVNLRDAVVVETVGLLFEVSHNLSVRHLEQFHLLDLLAAILANHIEKHLPQMAVREVPTLLLDKGEPLTQIDGQMGGIWALGERVEAA